MYSPIRRNRNIGTPKQGHSPSNKLTIPYSYHLSKSFYEQLDSYIQVNTTIQDIPFCFIVEKTRSSCHHACTVDDLIHMLDILIPHVPKHIFKTLNTILLRQPKRKEEILSPVWGRLIFSYELNKTYRPLIILEATNHEKVWYWPRKLTVEGQQELQRLRNDGHIVRETPRRYIIDFDLGYVRATQLYRTLLHEIGHYVQYSSFLDNDEGWEKYWQQPTSERESFAHRYADTLKQKLWDTNLLPFTRILHPDTFARYNLLLSDFTFDKTMT